MTFDSDYTFGATRVSCDIRGCNGEEEIEGWEGPLAWSDVSRKIKDMGWKIKNVGGNFIHVCPRHDTGGGLQNES